MTKTIDLKGGFIRKEGVASEAITPGHLVEFGGSNDLQKHSTAGGNARKAFALENDLVGEDISDPYDAGDTVQYGVFGQGSEVYALLADGQNVSKGAALESDGAGALRAHSGVGSAVPVEAIVAYALEAVNASGETRIKVEVA